MRGRAVAVLMAAALAGCDRPAPDRAAGGAAAVKDWTPIAHWSGRGSRQTETFTMLRHDWRLRWEANADANVEAPSLTVRVHSGDSGRVLATPLDAVAPGSGVVEIIEEPRQFYLTIDGSGVEWLVHVDEAGAAGAGSSRPAVPGDTLSP